MQYTSVAEVPDRINKGSNRLCPAMVAVQDARGALKTVLFELNSASWRVCIRQIGAFSFGKLARFHSASWHPSVAISLGWIQLRTHGDLSTGIYGDMIVEAHRLAGSESRGGVLTLSAVAPEPLTLFLPSVQIIVASSQLSLLPSANLNARSSFVRLNATRPLLNVAFTFPIVGAVVFTFFLRI